MNKCCYYSQFDYAVIKANAFNKTSFFSDVSEYSKILENTAGFSPLSTAKLADSLALANSSYIPQQISHVIKDVVNEFEEFFSSIKPNEIWRIPNLIHPKITDIVNLQWVVSVSLPQMYEDEGRLGTYLKSDHGYEIRIALGYPGSRIAIDGDILIRGVWWYICKILVYGEIGSRFGLKANEKFYEAAHKCLFAFIISISGMATRPINVEEHLRKQRLHLSLKLYNNLKDGTPEEWYEITLDWITNLITNREKRQATFIEKV